MARVYLETSFFGFCVTNQRQTKERGWQASSLEWWREKASRHDLFISQEVLRELSAPAFKEGRKALFMTYGLTLLDATTEVNE